MLLLQFGETIVHTIQSVFCFIQPLAINTAINSTINALSRYQVYEMLYPLLDLVPCLVAPDFCTFVVLPSAF